jgi:hypothetical protein
MYSVAPIKVRFYPNKARIAGIFQAFGPIFKFERYVDFFEDVQLESFTSPCRRLTARTEHT